MPMQYTHTAIPAEEVPQASSPHGQHLLDTYSSETNKVVSVWSQFTDANLEWRPHPRSSSVRDILRHQLLSERRFFAEFLRTPEPDASAVLPATEDLHSFREQLVRLARPRLGFLAIQAEEWWYAKVPFFDVRRERIWVFWRRILHTAHHRTQLTVYLRLLEARRRLHTAPPPMSHGRARTRL